MTNTIKHFFFPLLSFTFIFILSCQKASISEPGQVELRIHTPTGKASEVKLVTLNMLNYAEVPLTAIPPDTAGGMTIKFEIQKPTFASLKIEGAKHQVYLEPGNKLNISMGSDPFSPPIAYTGIGSQANNYIAGTAAIIDNFFQANGGFWRADVHKAVGIMDTLRQEFEQFHQNYTDTSSLNKEIQELFKARNNLIVIDLIQQYALINQIPFAERDGLPDLFKQNSSNVPMNIEYLNLGMVEYARVLDLYVRAEIHPVFLRGKEDAEMEALTDRFPAMSSKLIKAKGLPSGIREFLQAKDLDYWLALQGITPTLDTLYKEFQQVHASSRYGDELEKHYEDWMRIAPGKPAAEIIGINAQGDTLSLNEMKGKLIYIDVWATWCIPCKNEFAHYKGLQAAFEGRQEVEFLFVSIDKDMGAWTDFLQTESPPEGVHINDLAEHGGYQGVYKAYKMWGIPRYIIVDGGGKIVDSNAPAPSSGKVEEILKGLI